MKIKKVFILIFTLFIAFSLVGCGETNNEVAIGNNIEKSTTKLSNIIEKLESLDYDKIIIEDISPLHDSTFRTVSSKKGLEKSTWYAIGTTNKVPTNSLNRPKNAKYVSNDKIDLIREQSKNYKIKPISNTTCENGECNTEYKTNYTSNYKPRYVNEVSSNFTRESLDKYLYQIEVIYNTCADCVSCNAECNNESSRLKQNIGDCKVLGSKLKDGTIKLSENNINECNNCIDSLESCTYNLNKTKNNLSGKEKTVADLKDNLTKNLSELQDAYDKLLTALETRLEYLRNCNDCINSLADIINKTNVNTYEAEKNKSDEQDIILSEERLEEENATNEYQSYKTNNINKTRTTNYQKPITKKTVQRPILTQPNNNYRDNHNIAPIYENTNDMPANYAPYNNQNIVPYNNQSIAPFGYGYNNYPYPMRNIDTYRTINKNIDTFYPNYVPINNNSNYPFQYPVNQNGTSNSFSAERKQNYAIPNNANNQSFPYNNLSVNGNQTNVIVADKNIDENAIADADNNTPLNNDNKTNILSPLLNDNLEAENNKQNTEPEIVTNDNQNDVIESNKSTNKMIDDNENYEYIYPEKIVKELYWLLLKLIF